jgi:hypothetical protein
LVIKINRELSKKLEEVEERGEPDQQIPVIITLEPSLSLDVSTLEQDGLHIENRFSEINAVAGRISAANVKRLSKREGVKIIEYDSGFHAI